LKKQIGSRNGLRGIGDGSRGIHYSIGTFKDGTLHLTEEQIKNVTTPKKRLAKSEDQSVALTVGRAFSGKKKHSKKKGKGKKKHKSKH
jgi:hypothetical protein